MTIQDKTEAYYMAKFEDYIRQCKHLPMMPTGLCPVSTGIGIRIIT